ncbi:hypothetical protein, partial [Mycolicibacterium sp.]|uniref:hypothetical protein n=1 Tax=Mycolicibacterium sp. TaxID=2320850 RepID=UPI0037C6B833
TTRPPGLTPVHHTPGRNYRDGLMSKAEYEHTCWQVYDELAGERFVPANDPSSRQARTWASAATLADSYHR